METLSGKAARLAFGRISPAERESDERAELMTLQEIQITKHKPGTHKSRIPALSKADSESPSSRHGASVACEGLSISGERWCRAS